MRCHYKTEFPYFDFDIPQLPQGFIDMSWHNDVSPKFERKYGESHCVTLWIDYANEDRRECGGNQFILTIQPDDSENYDDIIFLLETNSWNEMFNRVNELFNEEKLNAA
jgi:hypothetical protein